MVPDRCESRPQHRRELARFKPFTSKDCDVLGDRKLLRELAARTRLTVKPFKFGQPTHCIGYLYDPDDPNADPVIEVLSGVRGLPSEEMAEPAEVEFDNSKFRALNPVDLLKAKLTNAVEIPQEGRQDVRHVRMLVPCARWYIAVAHAMARDGTAGDPMLLMRLLRKCIKAVDSPYGEQVGRECCIDLRRCFPWDVLRDSPFQPVRNFAKHRIP